ncbi:hypothetical protein MUK42_34254, partial [Musa troglodytarum]
ERTLVDGRFFALYDALPVRHFFLCCLSHSLATLEAFSLSLLQSSRRQGNAFGITAISGSITLCMLKRRSVGLDRTLATEG